MKRSEALAPLSRDHHHGLVVAQELRRATQETAAKARESFLALWDEETSKHFRIEEEVLLPACAQDLPPDDEAVVGVLVDHVQIRRQAHDLRAAHTPELSALHGLGDHLERHIRHEERVLFPLIEEALSETRLREVGAAVEAAEATG